MCNDIVSIYLQQGGASTWVGARERQGGRGVKIGGILVQFGFAHACARHAPVCQSECMPLVYLSAYCIVPTHSSVLSVSTQVHRHDPPPPYTSLHAHRPPCTHRIEEPANRYSSCTRARSYPTLCPITTRLPASPGRCSGINSSVPGRDSRSSPSKPANIRK